GLVQGGSSSLPVASVNVVIPVGDEVAERAARVAEGNTAIHATRALLGEPRWLDGKLKLRVGLKALLDRKLGRFLPLEFHEAGDFSHGALLSLPGLTRVARERAHGRSWRTTPLS